MDEADTADESSAAAESLRPGGSDLGGASKEPEECDEDDTDSEVEETLLQGAGATHAPGAPTATNELSGPRKSTRLKRWPTA